MSTLTYLLYTQTLANAFVCATKRYATFGIRVNLFPFALGMQFRSDRIPDTGGPDTIQ